MRRLHLDRSDAPGVLVACAALAAAVATWLATRDGPRITPDGITALRTAAGLPALEHPAGHFPGGYAAVLSALQRIGFTGVGAGRWLGVLLAALNTVLAAAVVRRLAGAWWAALIAATIAASATVAPLYAGLFSEPLFITVLLGWLLVVVLDHPAQLAAGGALAAAALMVRYIGAALVVAGIALLWRDRRRLLWYVAGVVPPIVVWAAARGEVSDRTVAWHPPAWLTIRTAFETLPMWITGERGGAWAGLLIALGAGLVLWHARRSPTGRAIGTVAAAYVGTLLLTVVLFDAQTPLDARLLAPLQVLVVLCLPAIVAAPASTAGRSRSSKARRSRRPAMELPDTVGHAVLAAGVGLVLLLNVGATHAALRDLDTSASALAHSPTVDAARGLPGPVVSNGPGALWLVADLDATWVPLRTSPYTQRDNEHLAEELAVMRAALAGGGHLVWLSFYDYRSYLPTEAEVVAALGLTLVTRLPDGAIYVAA